MACPVTCPPHHYVLPPPAGGSESLGVCRDCGHAKLHYNSEPTNPNHHRSMRIGAQKAHEARQHTWRKTMRGPKPPLHDTI
jgi:hypothetical protein